MFNFVIDILKKNLKLIIYSIIFILSLLLSVNFVNTPENISKVNIVEQTEEQHKSVKRELKSDKYLHNFQDTYHDNNEKQPKELMLTPEELCQYDGEEGSKGLYIAVLGSIYDVEKGVKHYGPTGSYHFFAGRDASTSFVTGEFEHISPDLDDVLSLSPKEILGLYSWKTLYDKDYTYVGKLVGRFYDETGHETEYHQKVLAKRKYGEEEKENEKQTESIYPPCNIEWKSDTGTRVWCTTKSGGQTRNWVGVPRKYYETGETAFRCACVNTNLLNSPNLKEYENCNPTDISCSYTVD